MATDNGKCIALHVFKHIMSVLPKTEVEYIGRQQALRIIVDAWQLTGTYRLAAGYKDAR